jgi:hypothetical protein
MGIVGIHPVVFVRVASTGVTGYGTWKSAQRKENRRFANALFARKSEKNVRCEIPGVPHPRAFIRISNERGCGRGICKSQGLKELRCRIFCHRDTSGVNVRRREMQRSIGEDFDWQTRGRIAAKVHYVKYFMNIILNGTVRR